ncbi:hypothetical protein [Streptomyces diastatochromogenes]|uniref:hypothetical protein n=1 Tax=Streptomyces diastatochromogenes TaxID=42236 RepID=UPI0036893BBB
MEPARPHSRKVCLGLCDDRVAIGDRGPVAGVDIQAEHPDHLVDGGVQIAVTSYGDQGRVALLGNLRVDAEPVGVGDAFDGVLDGVLVLDADYVVVADLGEGGSLMWGHRDQPVPQGPVGP